MSLSSIAALIIGGVSLFGGSGAVVGPIIGALIIAVLMTRLVMLNVTPFWQFTVVGSVAILAVLIDQSRDAIKARLDSKPWSRIKTLFDYSVFIKVSLETLEIRPVPRWRDNAYDNKGTRRSAQSNDIPNAKLVSTHSTKSGHYFCQSTDSKI